MELRKTSSGAAAAANSSELMLEIERFVLDSHISDWTTRKHMRGSSTRYARWVQDATQTITVELGHSASNAPTRAVRSVIRVPASSRSSMIKCAPHAGWIAKHGDLFSSDRLERPVADFAGASAADGRLPRAEQRGPEPLHAVYTSFPRVL